MVNGNKFKSQYANDNHNPGGFRELGRQRQEWFANPKSSKVLNDTKSLWRAVTLKFVKRITEPRFLRRSKLHLDQKLEFELLSVQKSENTLRIGSLKLFRGIKVTPFLIVLGTSSSHY